MLQKGRVAALLLSLCLVKSSRSSLDMLILTATPETCGPTGSCKENKADLPDGLFNMAESVAHLTVTVNRPQTEGGRQEVARRVNFMVTLIVMHACSLPPMRIARYSAG